MFSQEDLKNLSDRKYGIGPWVVKEVGGGQIAFLAIGSIVPPYHFGKRTKVHFCGIYYTLFVQETEINVHLWQDYYYFSAVDRLERRIGFPFNENMAEPNRRRRSEQWTRGFWWTVAKLEYMIEAAEVKGVRQPD